MTADQRGRARPSADPDRRRLSAAIPNGVEALRGVSLVAHEGEVVCIIGPSGSGKSTLLRCVNGLEPIDRGRILFGGREVRVKGREAREIRRQIGMVFQSFELFPHMTALANVGEGPRTVLRMPRAEVERERANSSPRSGWPTRPTRCRRSCPAASNNAWPSRARWPCSRARCCSTRRHRRSIRRPWARC